MGNINKKIPVFQQSMHIFFNWQYSPHMWW